MNMKKRYQYKALLDTQTQTYNLFFSFSLPFILIPSLNLVLIMEDREFQITTQLKLT